MIVEAVKTENGFIIPLTHELRNIKNDRIVLDVKIVKQEKEEEIYAPLDEMIGMCESGRSDASVNHDKIIYGGRGK